MVATYNLTLDVLRNGQQAKINARKGDNMSREIVVTLTANGEPVDLLTPEEAQARFYAKKPDGTCIYQDAVVFPEGNQIRLVPNAQTFTAEGVVRAEIQIIQAGTTIYSPCFVIEVEPTAYDESAVESTSEWTALEQLIATLPTLEDTANRRTSLANADNNSYPTTKAVSDALTGINAALAQKENSSNKKTTLANADNEGFPTTLAVANGLSGLSSSISSALAQKESTSNKVTSLSSYSTNDQYPGAKVVYDHVKGLEQQNNARYDNSTGTKIDLEVDSDYKVVAKLYSPNDTLLSTSTVIDLPLESVVVSGEYDSNTKKVILTLEDGSTIDFSVADLISGLASSADLATKVDKVTGKGLSTNDFTNADKTTLDGLDSAMSTVVPAVGALQNSKLDKYTASGDADMLLVSDGNGGVEESDVSLDDKLDAYTASGNTGMLLASDGNGGVYETGMEDNGFGYAATTDDVYNALQDAKDYADNCQSNAEAFAISEAQYAYNTAVYDAETYADTEIGTAKTWKHLGSVTGTTEITLPSEWTELACYLHYGTNTTALLHVIPNTGYSRVYRTILGYYANNSDYKAGTVEVNPTTNKLKLILYKIGVNDSTSGTEVDVYYR